ncbi:MAG: hypothetical protein A2X49_00440 [Lentisphaerae bacterium GWF2_52_8]|nr:MAG: hypothetical protein A2X49_00440 [Lentisphaerae bacterium GWF2_52_8]
MSKKLFCGALFMALVLCHAEDAQKIDPAWGQKIEWQKLANVNTLPAIQGADKLYDGDLKTAPALSKGGEAGSELTFKFPKAIDVTVFRFAQAGSCTDKYRLMADIEGKGDYSKLIVERKDEKTIRWEFISIPVNQKIFGLKLIALNGEIGYRSSFPNISEVEIYAKDKFNPPKGQLTIGPKVEANSFVPVPESKIKNIDIRICTDVWNYGLAQWKPEKTPLSEYQPYKNLVDFLKEVDANSVRFFDETESCADFLPWKGSKLVEDQYTHDYMKPLTDALKKDGYKLYYFTHAWKSPFQKRGERAPMPWCRWDYPYHQSDTLIGINKNYKISYPCVLCNPDYREKWTQMMREALQNGAAGVYLMPDEYYFKGHNLSRANCPECSAEFKKMFGYDSMPVLKAPANGTNASGQVNAPLPEDSEQYRKWKMFEYVKISELFKKVSADLRKEFPKAQLINNDNQACFEASLGRLEHTLASDIFGTDPNADFAQIYGIPSIVRQGGTTAYAKRFEASAGKDKMLASTGWGASQNNPVEKYGHILPEIMLGGKILEVYRQNYMTVGDGLPVYKELFKMVRLLEQWGIAKAEVPELACMLFSRAGEDWYYVKVNALMAPDKKGNAVDFYLHLADESINKKVSNESADDLQRFLAQDRLRGFGARMTMESMLTANGVPYKVAYTERPDNMKNLKRFKLLVMPFAYSLSKSAFEEIKAAVEAGTKLVIFEQLAPTDEFGNAYEKPLLEEFLGKPGVTFIKDSLADNSADMLKQAEYMKLFNSAIKDTGYAFYPNDAPVSYIVTALPDDAGYILYLANWESGFPVKKPATVTISLPGEGDYKMQTYSSRTHELTNDRIKGKDIIPADALKKFSVELMPQEVNLIRIYREKCSWCFF